jgi:outer membrane immunogenic protein
LHLRFSVLLRQRLSFISFITAFGGKTMLKKLLLTTAAVATMAGSALAADLPHYKAPPPPPLPILTWTGFYIGLNGGYIERQGTHFTSTPAGGIAAAVAGTPAATNLTFDLRRQRGGLGGGTVGYNWQANQYVVLGVEGDFDGVFLSNRCNNNNGGFGGGFGLGFGAGNNCNGATIATLIPGAPGFVFNSTTAAAERMDYFATARARFGVLPLPNVMVYATGGAAFANSRESITVTQNLNFPGIFPGIFPFPFGTGNAAVAFNQTRVGPTAGFGVEWMFLPGWSLKAEALYYDMRPLRATFPVNNVFFAAPIVLTSTAVTVEQRNRGVVARAGINYHFTWGLPAPVVARY